MDKKIKEMINSIKHDICIDEKSKLVEDGILTSLDIIKLISQLEDEFDIEISVKELVPENFNNIKSIEKMIKRIIDED